MRIVFIRSFYRIGRADGRGSKLAHVRVTPLARATGTPIGQSYARRIDLEVKVAYPLIPSRIETNLSDTDPVAELPGCCLRQRFHQLPWEN